jgi:hypothetical protein
MKADFKESQAQTMQENDYCHILEEVMGWHGNT